MIESTCETFFFKEDLRDIEKKGYGIVFSFNLLNHYCPTIVISKSDYAASQLKQLAIISMGSLSLINEIDIKQLADYQKVHFEVFKDQLDTAVQLFGSTIGTSTATVGTKAKPSGVLFTAASGIPAEPGGSGSSQAPQSSVDQPSPAPPISPPPVAKKKKGKIYLCEQCSTEFFKKTDFDDHMSKEHHIGKDLKCPHSGKDLSTQRSKKQHIRTQHLKIFKYYCPVLSFN